MTDAGRSRCCSGTAFWPRGRNSGFERVYDLSERVIPQPVADLPVPSLDEAQRELILVAARCLGVGTVADLADYFWVRPKPAALRVTELVEEGRLLPVAVEGWDRVAYVAAGARPRRPRRQRATLLSPFDSLIWARARTERLFGFHYRIGIYVPEHLRTHGYYVLPLLVGDQLVARFDLKADRKTGTLRVMGSFAEPEADPAAVLDAAAAELGLLRDWLGLGRVAVAARGNLAPGLRRAVAAGARTAPPLPAPADGRRRAARSVREQVPPGVRPGRAERHGGQSRSRHEAHELPGIGQPAAGPPGREVHQHAGHRHQQPEGHAGAPVVREEQGGDAHRVPADAGRAGQGPRR